MHYLTVMCTHSVSTCKCFPLAWVFVGPVWGLWAFLFQILIEDIMEELGWQPFPEKKILTHLCGLVSLPISVHSTLSLTSGKYPRAISRS